MCMYVYIFICIQSKHLNKGTESSRAFLTFTVASDGRGLLRQRLLAVSPLCSPGTAGPCMDIGALVSSSLSAFCGGWHQPTGWSLVALVLACCVAALCCLIAFCCGCLCGGLLAVAAGSSNFAANTRAATRAAWVVSIVGPDVYRTGAGEQEQKKYVCIHCRLVMYFSVHQPVVHM